MTDEFLCIWRKLMQGEEVTETYPHLRIEKGKLLYPPQQKPYPPIYFGGSSDAGGVVAAKHVDVYLAWDDERLFQTARNILTLMVCRIVLDEYINHITPYHFRFSLDPTLSARLARAPWHRENWASFEFSLVYRWHSLIPPTLKVGPEQLPLPATLVNGTLLAEHGLARTMEDASLQRGFRPRFWF